LTSKPPSRKTWTKNIIHTLRYVHLAEAIFPETTDKYYTRVTSTIKEGEQLVQQGFELAGRDESVCLWRKRKTFEDIAKEREQKFSFVKSENSGEKIL
jgi:hypothetical protein